MSYRYIIFKIDTKTKQSAKKAKSTLSKTVEKFSVMLLSSLIPKANPDFNDSIDDVATWLLEIDEDSKIPNREIGINDVGLTIMIMPFGLNSGYWTDNNLKHADFIKLFHATEVAQDEFNHLWDMFKK